MTEMGNYCILVHNVGRSVDAVTEAVLSEVDLIYSLKAEKRTTLKTFPTSD